MVNFNPGFVSEAVRRVRGQHADAGRRAAGRGRRFDGHRRLDQGWAKRAPHATLQQVADHIEHIRDVAGVDHVGLGSDFDGITSVPDGLENSSKFPDLVAELLRRGWKADDVKKVVGLNALRVLRDAAKAAEALTRPRRYRSPTDQ